MSEALVVADDLTGAMDTGHAFAARGYRTTVAIDPALSMAGVLVANTDSRYRDPETAAERVRAAVAGHDPAHVYKKVDSTLRGNLAAEVDAALEAAGSARALVAPAFPANGRLTACGYHLLDGAPVAETPPGRDPDSPVESSYLPTLFSASRHPVEHVGVETVAAGADAVGHAVSRAPAPAVVTADAVHEDHLAALATGVSDVVYVGSAGLAAHVPLPDVTRREAARPPAPDSPRVLGVAGSVNPATLAQLDAVADAVVALDAATAVTDPEAAAADAADAARGRLAAGSPAVVASATGQADVEAAMDAAAAEGVPESEARERIARALALAAGDAWGAGPSGLFLTGGATATAVLDRLAARGVELLGEAVGAGIPAGRVVGGAADDAPVVTKAGGFGGPDAIADALAYLGGEG